MTNETDGPSKSDGGRLDASSAATARKINRLPPGEHLVVLRAKPVSNQMVLRIAAYSAELQAGTVVALDKIFGPQPPPSDVRGRRAYSSQGTLWLNIVAACGLDDSELMDVTLDALAEKISDKQAIVIISDSGYWSRVRPL
jgi:hypothetical protein